MCLIFVGSYSKQSKFNEIQMVVLCVIAVLYLLTCLINILSLIQASYDYTMINAERTMVKAKSSYTFGSMPTQRNDVTLSLDEEKFVMEFADSSNIYTCEVSD